MLSETEPDTEAGEFVARDGGAEETGSSTMTSMSLLLSSTSGSGGREPGWSSLLREIWPHRGAHTDTHTGRRSALLRTWELGWYSRGIIITTGQSRRQKRRNWVKESHVRERFNGQKGKVDKQLDKRRRDRNNPVCFPKWMVREATSYSFFNNEGCIWTYLTKRTGHGGVHLNAEEGVVSVCREVGVVGWWCMWNNKVQFLSLLNLCLFVVLLLAKKK